MTNVWFLQAVAAVLVAVASALIFRELLRALGPERTPTAAARPRPAARVVEEPPLRRAA
jgi:hypothetical protein